MLLKKTKNESKSKRPTNQEKVFDLPSLPSMLTQPLGLEGWGSYEPVLLAALVSGEPLLLIGPHGSAKSFLIERLAQVMGLEYRFYNASLLNYDDLVGIPMPDEERKSLRYISTPSAIWDAEVVFFDEINRTRPDLQNKLFPIVHERRVQGISLEKLRYRWAAMNPPPAAQASEEAIDVYFGAEPLDPALADRFNFLAEVPGWQNLTEEEKRRIFRDQFKGAHAFPIPLPELVETAREYLDRLQQTPPQLLEDYLLNLLSQLESNKLFFSARRATMLHRNILAVHAARTALYKYGCPDFPSQLTDWNTSALIALQNSIPQLGEGRKPDPAVILAAHRHAWEVSKLDTENPWRQLLQIADPLERCIMAIEMGDKVSDENLSQLVLDGLSAQADRGRRTTAALAIYLAVHKKRNLRATVFETLAQDLRIILKPWGYSHEGDDFPRQRYRSIKEICNKLEKDTTNSNQIRDRYAMNLLMGLIPDGYESLTPRQIYDLFKSFCDRMHVEPTGYKTAGEIV